MHRSEEECDQLVDDATQMFETFPVDAAMVFEDAGKCYDERGERTRAAQYYTLAGDMYFRCNRDKKAEKCYARAIIRNLMANDVEAAKVVLQRGSDLGFETSMFRIAAKSVQRRLEEEEIEVITPVQIAAEVEITATPVSISDVELRIPEEVQEIDLEQHVLESVQEFELSGVEEGEIVEASSTDKIMAAMAQKQRVTVQDHEIESLSTTISKEDQRVLKVTSILIPSQATDRVLPIRDTELPEAYSLTDVSVQPSSAQDISEPGEIDLPETISVSTPLFSPPESLTDEFHSLDITVPEKSDSIDLVIPKHLDSIKMRVPENIEKLDLLVPSDKRLKLLPQEGKDFIDLIIPKTLTRFALLLPEKEDTLTIPVPRGLDHIDVVLTEKVENIEVWNETIGEYETISIQDSEVPLRLPVPKDKDFITVRLPEGLKKLDVIVPEGIDSLRFQISPERAPMVLEVPEELDRLGINVSKQEFLDIAV
ncbi:MAG: hypothetical protein ACFFCQ_14260, partial [Promethearchaeota archaeon]